jgi:hypothetical protein
VAGRGVELPARWAELDGDRRDEHGGQTSRTQGGDKLGGLLGRACHENPTLERPLGADRPRGRPAASRCQLGRQSAGELCAGGCGPTSPGDERLRAVGAGMAAKKVEAVALKRP